MNAKSRLNFDINGCIGAGNALLGTTSGELFMCNLTGKSKYINEEARRKSRHKWVFSGIKGSVCFVCDNTDVYHFKIFRQPDLKELFSISLDNSTEYMKLTEHFFYFDSHEGLIGFNIVDKKEAVEFYNVINAKLPRKEKAKRRESKTKRKGSKVGLMFFGQSKAKKSSGGSKRFLRNSKRRGSKKKRREPLLSISDLTPEWKTFLKESGIRKKDFKKPKVQQLIRTILKQANVSPTPPPTDLTLTEAKKYYPDERDFKNYQKYKQETLKYEQEVEKYENELKQFNSDLYRSSKATDSPDVVIPRGGSKRELPTPPPRAYRNSKKPVFNLEPPSFPALPVIDRVEQELDDFLDDEKFSKVVSMRDAASSKQSTVPPPPPKRSAPPGLVALQPETPREIQRMRKTVGFADFSKPKETVSTASTAEMPKVVLDLSLDEKKHKEEATIVTRPLQSTCLTPQNKLTEKEKGSQNKTFSVLIKKQKEALTHLSRLPDLGTVRKKDENLLTTLMRKLKSRRDELVSSEEEDGDESDWSVEEDEEGK